MPDLCHSQVGHDTIMHQADTLPDVQITTRKNDSHIAVHHNEIVTDLRLMDDLPKIMGNTDPLRYTQALPMVQTNNEYDGGLHIQGCDNGNNMLSIDGATIYNASHLFGFFSVFNTSHYDKMSLRYSSLSASDPDRLGGHLRIYHTDSIDSGKHGTYTIGPMSSQGTLRFQTSAKSSLKLSIRASYLNLLYGSLLRQEEYDINYFFDDINLTYKYAPSADDLIWVDLYGGFDKCGLNMGNTSTDMSLKWGNAMLSAHWKHQSGNGLDIHQMACYSYYSNKAAIDMDNVSGTMPSNIGDLSYKADLSYKNIMAGISASMYHIQPQNPTSDGACSIKSSVKFQQAQELSAYADVAQPLSAIFSINAGLRGSLFFNPERKAYSALDPSATLSADLPTHTLLTLSASTRHQYLFNIGISDMNMPIEFWMASYGRFAPQHSANVDFTAEQQLCDNKYSLQLRLFYKKLWNQLEYKGSACDILFRDFCLEDYLMHGNGENYGFSIMFCKKSGKLTGHVSYTYTHARRSFEQLKGKSSYPASHERPHEINALATYSIGRRWRLGATYVFASGTPFTAPKSFHVYNGNIVSSYGEHNANRLPAYSRLDVSACYVIKKGKSSESGLNLSLYNVLYRSNPLFYRLKFYDDAFAYRRLDFLVKILPSISFYHNF